MADLMLHCPYCGTTDLVYQRNARPTIRCESCDVEEDLPAPAFVASRAREVMELSGASIAAWKAKGASLGPTFRYRWRTTLRWLHPTASAALSVMDELMCDGASEAEALARVREDWPTLEALVQADPDTASCVGPLPTFLDDWF